MGTTSAGFRYIQVQQKVTWKPRKVDKEVIPRSRMEKSSSSTKRFFWGPWVYLLLAARSTARAHTARPAHRELTRFSPMLTFILELCNLS